MPEAPRHTPVGTSHVAMVWSVVTVLAASAALLTRYCDIPAASIGFWRVAGAAVVLLPFWLRQWLQEGRPTVMTAGAALAGTFLGLHFATWCWSIQHTTIANAALFIGLQPLISPFIARVMIGERLNRWEIVAVLLAFAGMVWLMGGQLMADRSQIAGMLMALLSAGFCSMYFVLGRKYRTREHVLLYSVAVFAAAAVVQAVCALVVDHRIAMGGGRTQFALAGLVLLPTVGGHTLAMYLLRHAKAQVVVLSVPAQFVLSAVLAVPLFHEVPDAWFYPGATLVMAGVVMGVVKGAHVTEARNS